LLTAHEYGVTEVVFGRDHGQDPLLNRVRYEFRRRHVLIRLTALLCVAAPTVARTAEPLLRRIAELADRMHAFRVSRSALSVIYNGAYYRGMAEQLGGRAAFRDTIVRRRVKPIRRPDPDAA
jgi:hypothetical protein